MLQAPRATWTLAARQALWAWLCLAVWEVLTSLWCHILWQPTWLVRPMLDSKTFGDYKIVPKHSTNLATKTSACDISHAFVRAKQCQWTLQSPMQVPTFSRLCLRLHSAKKTIAGISMA